MHLNPFTFFGDRHENSFQTMPTTNAYVHLNPDEMDHMLVDPAYRLEKLKEMNEKAIAMQMAYMEVDNQLSQYGSYH